jgi:hypothetical protein
MYNEIYQAYFCGFHVIELNIRLGVETIKTLNNYVDTLGVAVNIFTLNESNYLSLAKELKYNVDSYNVSLFVKLRAILHAE